MVSMVGFAASAKAATPPRSVTSAASPWVFQIRPKRMVNRLSAASIGKDFRQIAEDLVDFLSFQLALLKGKVRLDALVDVQQHGHVGVLGDLVRPRTGRIVNGKNGFLEFFFVGECFQLLVQIFLIAEEYR